MDVLIALDQGTTSSRCLGFDAGGNVVALAQREFAQHFPRDGWVEHEPEDIWRSTLESFDAVVRELLAAGHAIVGIGISNQRETTLLWDRRTGEAVHRAIVWQDRRTADACARLQQEGLGECVATRTGLLLDPYFSATKLAWILDNVAGARARAEAGELAFGTIDTFLLWRLTGGRRHCTDATNASRTMLFDIHAQRWDEELLARFGVPRAVLPEVLDSAADFGTVQAGLPAAGVPIAGIAGDQQAALIGQGCLAPGQAKSTYGTGCFLVLNTGATPVRSQNRLLTTVAYRLDGKPTYALEGSIFVAGAAIKWLRDALGLIASAGESEQVALRAPDPGGVYLVPAFTGLGAPHWDPASPRRDPRAHARQRRRGDRHRGAAVGGLPDPRPARCDGARRHDAGRAARGRRHGRQQLDAAVHGRHAGHPGQPPAHHRGHRAGRGEPGGLPARRAADPGSPDGAMRRGATLPARDARARARASLRRLAGRGGAGTHHVGSA